MKIQSLSNRLRRHLQKLQKLQQCAAVRKPLPSIYDWRGLPADDKPKVYYGQG